MTIILSIHTRNVLSFVSLSISIENTITIGRLLLALSEKY